MAISFPANPTVNQTFAAPNNVTYTWTGVVWVGDAPALPAATDTTQGKVALNNGTALPADASNATDALTAGGATTLMNDTTVSGGNAVQKAVVNAVEAALGSDATAQAAIATALKEEIHSDFPAATDTVQGKVALNNGTTLPTDSTNATDALTAAGIAAIIGDDVNTVNAIQLAIRKLLGAPPVTTGFDWNNATATPNAYSTHINASGNGIVTPTHLGMKRCTLLDNGTVNYYLDPANSNLKADGTGANLTGADGQVMVEIPKFWWKPSQSGSVVRWEISHVSAYGYEVHPAFIKDGVEVNFRYYGSYDAAVFDTSANAVIGGLNSDNNLARVDLAADKLVSVSGAYPMVGLRRSDFRALAANRGAGWSQIDFWLVQAVQLLYLVEFGTFNSQLSLGDGNTAVSTGYPASSANQTDSPQSVAGKSNSLGNASTNATTGASSATRDTAFMSYRGIENFFGNCWNWVDGFNINNDIAWVKNTRPFADDTSVGHTNVATLPSASGSVATVQSAAGAILPATVGAGSTTGVTDYYYTGASTWRVAVVGGAANDGAGAGAFFWSVAYVSGGLSRAVGARVAF